MQNEEIIVFNLSESENLFKNLSLESQGLLSCMVNNPEFDYSTMRELHEMLPDNDNSIDKSVNELVKNNFLFDVNGRYAINKKQLICNMHCVNIENCKGVVCNG